MTATTETTEARPETGATAAARPRPPLTGLAGVLTTGSGTRIGGFYVVWSLVFLVAAGVAGELAAVERIQTDELQVLGEDVAGQVLSFHAVAAVFCFLLPLFVGLGTAIVPLQVGASTVAFPRAAAAAFWGWLLGSLLLIGSYVANGGPGGGEPRAVDLFLLALGVQIAALVLGAVCVATTVLTLRARGLTLGMVPAFSWAMLVASFMWVVTLPVLAANVIVTFLDHRYGQAFLGGSPGVAAQIGWAFTSPTVYLYAIPVLGLVGDVVPVFRGARPRRPAAARVAIAVFAVLAFGAYAQPFAAVDTTEQVEMGELAIVLLLPLLLLAALLGDTVRGGRPRLAVPFVLGVLAFLLLLAGAVAGALAAIGGLDLAGTSWETGEVHLVLLGAGGLGAVGALHYWLPKLSGRLLSPAFGMLEALLLLGGVALLAGADLVAGALDQPAGQLTGEVRDGVEVVNAVSAVGGGLVLLAVLVLLVDVVLRVARRRGPAAGDDPWDGHTLEWATTSPPPHGNFAEVPEVTSDRPLLDRRTATAGATAEVA